MSYTPTVWTSGDIVTSAKLNKIENGIAAAADSGGVEIYTGTYQEIEIPNNNDNEVYGLVFPITYGQAWQKLNDGISIFLKASFAYGDYTIGGIVPISLSYSSDGIDTVYSLGNVGEIGDFFVFYQGNANTYIGDFFDVTAIQK